jgi:CRP/FNR family transcriptional regulator, cyclic AMP receptor protein
MADPMFEKFGVVFKPGQIIFCEYEPGNELYLIKEGKVKVSKVVDDREKTLDEFGPGDVFGEMAILEEAPRTATAVAVEETQAMAFNKENFEHLIKGNPAIALKLLTTFARRIADAKRRLQTMGLKSEEDKVIDTLLMLAEQAGANLETTEPVDIDTTDEDIANWCSVPVDSAKRILRSLHNQGRVVNSSKKIVLKNYRELHRVISSKRKNQQ